MYEATIFKFGGSTAESSTTGMKNPQKGAWSGSRDHLKNFKPLQYFWIG